MRVRHVVGALSAVLVLTAATTLPAAAAMRRPARTSASAEPQCGLLATVGSTAAAIQQAVQAQSGQQLPVDLAGTVGQVAAQAGCGGGGGSPAPGGATPAPLCGLLATVGSTAAAIQQTVQAQSGQQLPVDLAGTVGQVAAQAGCAAVAPGGHQATTTTTTTPPSNGSGSGTGSGFRSSSTGGSTGRSGSASPASVLGETTAPGELPRTGGSFPYGQCGGAALGLAGLADLTRRRLTSSR